MFEKKQYQSPLTTKQHIWNAKDVLKSFIDVFLAAVNPWLVFRVLLTFLLPDFVISVFRIHFKYFQVFNLREV